MIKFRPHRGGLSESLAETKEFEGIDSMFSFIIEQHHGAFDKSDIVIDEDIRFDNRCGWNTQHVCVRRYFDKDYIKLYNCPQCIGMCDLGLEGE